MKVTVIGGGSTYTPELINGFLARTKQFPLTELWLMDIDPHRLEVVGGFAQRMVAAKGVPFSVHLTTDQREAVKSAAYVCTQLRVGQMEARRADEYLGQRHGLIGQETTGVGGMAKALRTIPVILRIASDMRELAPGALLVNFTNPAGIVTEALQRYASDVSAVGVCNVPITTKMRLLELFEQEVGEHIAPERAELKTLGLNHLTWHRGLSVDGEDVWARLFEVYVARQKAAAKPDWNIDTLTNLRLIPNYYLQYFYHTDHKLEAQKAWPPSRADEVMAIEEGLLRYYGDPANSEPPADLMKRGGAYYSTVATQLLAAHHGNLGEAHIVNTRHNGAVPGWPAEWVLELPCKVDRQGVHPLPAEPLPLACFGLISQVKAYELLTVEAAVHGDRRAAYQAL
ncbi:MAG TPA: 6-phospho-beta-glucosidase, partial [Anaerolineales bacterium]|nr:6-phospho-beta-glucosidase [Anaerolineales bacterium]